MPTGYYKRTEYHKSKLRVPHKGTGVYKRVKKWKVSEEGRKNISNAHKGLKQSQETIDKRKFFVTGKLSGMWKGDKAGYFAIHSWVKRWKGKPSHCEMCGKKEKRAYQWANIDHKYRRVLEDYISLCVPCHRIYDKTNNA
jgi:hypothetical protein